MFGNNNRSSLYWNNTGQANPNLSGAFNALGYSVPTGQQSGSMFTSFGSGNTMANTGFVNQSPAPAFGTSQNTSLFGQTAQQPASTGFGGMSTNTGLFSQNKQSCIGNSSGLFSQSTQGGGMFSSNLNTGINTGFGSTATTGTSMFGGDNKIGGMWSSGSDMTSFGAQIQGTEVAGPKHFDGATITHISYDKPDTCQEEYRWEFYKKQNPQFSMGGMQQATAAPTGGLFGSSQPAATSGGLFSNTQQTTTGGLFGTTQPTTTSGGLFGSTQTPNTSGGLFGTTQPMTTTTGGLFGNTQQSTTGGGLFSNPQPTTGGLFGNTQPTNTTGGIFGNTQTGNTTTGGLFGTTQPTNTTGGLFGNTQSTTTGSSGLFGGMQSNTGTGLFGTTQPGGTGTGLFGSTTTGNTGLGGTNLFGSVGTSTASTGIFGSNNSANFNTNNKNLFSTSSTLTGTNNTTGTGLFGSNNNLFGSSTTPGTTNTGTTGIFGTTTGNTSGNLFGSTTTPGTNTMNNLFGSSSTTPSTNLFGTTNNTGSTNLFGTSTFGSGNTSSSFGLGTTGSNLFGTTQSGAQQYQQQGNMKLGPVTLNWNFNTPSPGLKSFWSTGVELPQEARDYLAKMSNTLSNSTDASFNVQTNQQNKQEQKLTSFPEEDNNQDRFGLRKILKELGVTIPRYSLHRDQSYERTLSDDEEKRIRSDSFLKPEDKVEHDLDSCYQKFSKVNDNSKLRNYYSQVDTLTTDTFLSLHNGGAKEFDALRFQARGGQLRKTATEPVSNDDEVPYLPSKRSSGPMDVLGNTNKKSGDLLTMTDEAQRGSFSSFNNSVEEAFVSHAVNFDNATPINGVPSIEESVTLDNDSTISHRNHVDSENGVSVFTLADDGPGKPPMLTKQGYTTRPTMSSLKLMSDRQLANVMDFQIIHEGFGEILWPGYTDLRQLNLDKIVDIAHRKVTMYGNTSNVHPVGEGLNKNAVVTLYNCAPKDVDHDGSITRTVDQMEKLKQHTNSMGCKFVSANLKTGQWTFEAPYFVKNGSGDTLEGHTMSLGAVI